MWAFHPPPPMGGWLGLGNWLGAGMAKGTALPWEQHGVALGGNRQEAATA